MTEKSLGPDYFERLYATQSDPWNFSSSPYEARKYADTIDMLGEHRYPDALEIGCSIGVLTAHLSKRCDRLLSVDINERALRSAAERNAGHGNVRFERMTVPGEMPGGRFDLVVLSEVGYYWSDDDLALARTRIAAAAPGGTLILVHFLPKVDEYLRDGDRVHQAFLDDERFVPLRASRAETYRIDVLDIRS